MENTITVAKMRLYSKFSVHFISQKTNYKYCCVTIMFGPGPHNMEVSDDCVYYFFFLKHKLSEVWRLYSCTMKALALHLSNRNLVNIVRILVNSDFGACIETWKTGYLYMDHCRVHRNVPQCCFSLVGSFLLHKRWFLRPDEISGFSWKKFVYLDIRVENVLFIWP